MSYWSEDLSSWLVVEWAVMLVFWAAIVGVTLWVVARVTSRSRSDSRALSIARERYTQGEMNKHEYERIGRGLSQ